MHVHVYVPVHVIFDLAHVICMPMYMYACILQGIPAGGSWGRQGQMLGGGTADGGGARQEGGGGRSGSGKRARHPGGNGGGKREVCDPQSCNNTNIGVTPNS